MGSCRALLGLLVLDVALVTSSPTPANNYQVLAGHQIWRAEGGRHAAAMIGRLEVKGLVDVLGHHDALAFRVFPASQDAVSASLRREGIKYHVVVSDLRRHLAEEERRVKRSSRQEESCLQNACPKPLITRYMSFLEMEWYLHALAASSPRVELKSIGKTSEGRDIWMVHIKPNADTGAKKRDAIWIEGGIHAREWISGATTLQLLDKLASDDTRLTRDLDIYIAPMANPDGYEYSRTTDRMWRKNRSVNPARKDCPGVDLNRNWDQAFGVGASTNPCSDVYQGSTPFSERETTALKNEMMRVSTSNNLLMVMAFHSYGQLFVYPWGHTLEEAPNTPGMRNAGKMFAQAAGKRKGGKKGTVYEVSSSSNGMYFASGATDDWSKAALEVPYSYTVELPDEGRHGFILPPSFIKPTVQDVWRGLKKMMPLVRGS